MTTLVVHESMFGNTRAIAEAIAADLPGHVEVVDVTDEPAPLPAHVDLLVVGGPTHAFSMSRAGTRRDAVAQGAAHERRLPGSAARAAGKVAARRGLGRVVAVESFYVEDVSGPLLEGELERARAWARSLDPIAHPR